MSQFDYAVLTFPFHHLQTAVQLAPVVDEIFRLSCITTVFSSLWPFIDALQCAWLLRMASCFHLFATHVPRTCYFCQRRSLLSLLFADLRRRLYQHAVLHCLLTPFLCHI